MLLHRQNVAGPNYIAGLGPVAWFRNSMGQTVAGSGVSQWDDQAGTTRFLSLPGTASNNATSPDSAPSSIVGDIDLIVRVSATDYSPAGAQTVLAKADGTNNRSYYLTINNTGTLVLATSPDGTAAAQVSGTSTVAPTATDGTAYWLRATLDVDDGGGNRVYNFYQAADQSSEPSSWTQVGTTVTTAGATSIANTNAVLEVGSVLAGSAQLFIGRVYRAIIKSGIGGTTVVDFNPDLDGTSGATSMTSSVTSEVWTVNQTSTNNPARLCKGNALAMGVAANRPIGLLHTGTNYLYLPGVAGNYASTPNAAANQFGANIDVRFRVMLTDWTPAATNVFMNKHAAAGAPNYAWDCYMGAATIPVFRFSIDGTVLVTATATTAITASDGDTKWIRVTRDSTSGDVIFYTAADSSSEPTSWTQLGTTVSATAGAINNGNAALWIGQSNAGALPVSGKIYRASIYSTIGGTTPVVDFNPALATDQAATFVASTGETWTINKTGSKPAQIVARSSILFDGAAHFLKCSAFTLNQPETVFILFKQVSWTAGEYVCDGNALNSGSLSQQTAGVSPQLQLYAGASGVAGNTNLVVGSYGVACCIFNGASSVLQINNTTASTGNAGAANMGGFTLGSSGTPSVWSNIQVLEAIIFPTAHDATTRARVIQYLNFVGRLGI